MDIETKVNLVKGIAEEIITEEELRNLFQTKDHPVAYDGFEPSGRPTIAQGLLRAITINKLVKSGVKFVMLAADWHGWTNNKMGGDLEKIQVAGDFLIEVWKASGMRDKVVFKRSSDLIYGKNYWKTVLQIARHTTVQRMVRCAQIMGRSESEILSSSQIIYPAMQCADIFELGCDITQLGMDQRKVNILAREIGPALGFWKPVVISHHMLMGLQAPPEGSLSAEERAIKMKMSKSKPDTAIFMDDSEEEIKRKINKAYCPEKQVQENPILEYCKYIIFEKFKTLEIERPKKFGGNLEIPGYQELEKIYSEGKLHPMDLKNAVALKINELMVPVRGYFEKNKKARDLRDQVQQFQLELQNKK